MTQWYDHKQKTEILRSLGIKPKEGKVTSSEAARILTWRAKAENNIEHEYPTSILRRHAEQGNLKAYSGTKGSVSRKNLYDVDAVFELSIVPTRGLKRMQQKQVKEAA